MRTNFRWNMHLNERKSLKRKWNFRKNSRIKKVSALKYETLKCKPGQHFGEIALNVAGSGAHSKQFGSIISNPNVDGHSIFSQ